jgi:hypothetical protein
MRGQAPYSWSVIAGSLPLDLTLSTSGEISGSVVSSFLAFFTVQVMDQNGDTATRDLSIQVNIPNCYNCHANTRL